MGKPQNGKKNGAQGMSPAKAIQQGQIKKNKQEKFKKTPVGKVQVVNGKTNGNAANKKQANNASPVKKQQQNVPSPKKNNNKNNNNNNKNQNKKNVPAPKQNKKAAVVVEKEDDTESESELSDIDESCPVVPEIVSEEDDDTDSDSDMVTATPDILGQSLADDTDDDDEDFDDEEEEKKVVSKNGKKMGIKPFEGVSKAEETDLDTTVDSSVNSSMVTDEDDEDDEDDDDDDDDEDEDEDDNSGLKALIGDSILDSENDEDFEEDEDDDDDDDEEEDEEDDDEEEEVDDKELNQSSTSIVEVKNGNVQLLSKEEKAEQDSRTIFIGNVPIAVDEKKIRAAFKSFGPIETIRIRGVIPESPKVSKKVAAITKKFHPKATAKCAFVVFKSADSVDKALSLNGTQLEGNYLRVDRSNSQRQVDAKKAVFLGNLPFDLEDNDLWEMFSKCGKIDWVRSVRDRITGCCRGLAYINFVKEDSVALALNLNGQKLKNREMRVTPYKVLERKPKRARTDDSSDSSPAKKTKREIAIATHNSVGAEKRKNNNNKRSQGQKQRSESADSKTPEASPKAKSKFQGQKADKKPFKKGANKFEKQKKNMAAKLTAKPKKPVKN